MFWPVKFSDEFEAEISRLKVKAEAWGRAKAIEEARKRGKLDESEENIDFLAFSIAMLTLDEFSDTLMNTEIEKDESKKRAAFYREEPEFDKELERKYRALLPTLVKEILAADQKLAGENSFLSDFQ